MRNANMLWGNVKQNNISKYSETPEGTIDSANTIFSSSNSFIQGTLKVYINGLREWHFMEISDTQFELEEAPSNNKFTDILKIEYIKK